MVQACRSGWLAFGLLSLVGPGVLADVYAAEGEPASPPVPPTATSAAQAFLEQPPKPTHIGLGSVLSEIRLSAPVLAGSETSLLIELMNTGTTPIIISDVHLGCACGQVVSSPSSIDPDGRAAVRLAYRAGPKTGEIRHLVEVLSSDATRPRLAIPVLFTVVAPIDLTPASVDLGSVPAETEADPAAQRTVAITVHQSEPVVITGVRTANPWIIPVLSEIERGRRYTVTVSLAASAPPGPIQGQVLVEAEPGRSGQPMAVLPALTVSARKLAPP